MFHRQNLLISFHKDMTMFPIIKTKYNKIAHFVMGIKKDTQEQKNKSECAQTLGAHNFQFSIFNFQFISLVSGLFHREWEQ